MGQPSNYNSDSLRAGSPSRVRALRAPAHAALDRGHRYGWQVIMQSLLATAALSRQPFTTNCSHTKFLTDPAWASHKSFKRKDADPKTPPDDPGNPSVDFHGERRSNDTHQSTTDPEAHGPQGRRARRRKLCYAGQRADGEPPRHRGRRLRSNRLRLRRADRRHGDGGEDAGLPANNTRCRQGLRTARIGRRSAGRQGHPTPRAAIGPRRRIRDEPDHSSSGYRSASASVSGSRKSSAGSKRSQVCAKLAIAASSAPNSTPIWWPPLTIRSESRDSARHQREPRRHHIAAPPTAGRNRRAQQLNPALLSLRWRSH